MPYRLEKDYCATRKEMPTVVHFVRYFRHYSLGYMFTIGNNYKALKWSQNFRDHEERIAKWKECLQEHDYECIYWPTKQN